MIWFTNLWMLDKKSHSKAKKSFSINYADGKFANFLDIPFLRIEDFRNDKILKEISKDDKKNSQIEYSRFDSGIIKSSNPANPVDFSNCKILPLEQFFTSKTSDLKNFDKHNYIFDCHNYLVLPGGIDAHVHFDTPGYTYREDFSSGSAAALAGGITTVIDMPCTSIPEVTNRKNLKDKLAAVEPMARCDYAFYGGICGKTVDSITFESDIEDLVLAGVKGFKGYTISGMDSFPRLTNAQLFRAAKVIKEFKKPILLHSEDSEIIYGLTEYNKDIIPEYKKYTLSRPAIAELISVMNAAAIASQTSASFHIVHLSSAAAAKFLGEMKDKVDITFETAPHYLEFTEKDFEKFGSLLKTAPPVKSDSDREILIESVLNKNCLFIASDHAGCTYQEKHTGSFLKDYSGIPGVQTLLLYSVSKFYDKLNLEDLYKLIAENQAKRYGLYPKKGCIEEDSDADFVFIDLNKKQLFKNENLLCKSKETIFDNYLFNYSLVGTVLRAMPAYFQDTAVLLKPGSGKYI